LLNVNSDAVYYPQLLVEFLKVSVLSLAFLRDLAEFSLQTIAHLLPMYHFLLGIAQRPLHHVNTNDSSLAKSQKSLVQRLLQKSWAATLNNKNKTKPA